MLKLVAIGAFGYYVTDTRGLFHQFVTMPLLRLLDPETAHILAIKLASCNLSPKERIKSTIPVEIWGKKLDNPIGLAAGFDKNGEAVDAMFDLGFGMVEVGSVCPNPQVGNPRPRLFRYMDQMAIVNRYGFNSDGHEAVLHRLKRLKRREGRLLGVNLGKNKDSDIEDYVRGVVLFADVADYLVINVSSPNTPGLRDIQQESKLLNLLKKVMDARDQTNKNLPICLKISPDLNEQELLQIAKVVRETKVDGLILTNTTTEKIIQNQQEGGLSGKPLFNKSLETVKFMKKLLDIPIIGCGGIMSAKDAMLMNQAGAKCVQVYSLMALNGPEQVTKLKQKINFWI